MPDRKSANADSASRLAHIGSRSANRPGVDGPSVRIEWEQHGLSVQSHFVFRLEPDVAQMTWINALVAKPAQNSLEFDLDDPRRQAMLALISGS